MSETSQLPVSIPKTAIVIFNDGAFGGAVARFTSLFLYLNKKFPHKFYYFINTHLFNQINEIYKDLPLSNIRIIGRDSSQHNFSGSPPHLSTDSSIPLPRYYKDTIPDPEEVDRRTSFPRKIYWYYKNKFKQHALFRKIEKLREELDIKVFTGVFAGILPLIFYLNISPKKAAVIFSDMDSWFTDVHWDMKKLWYRKYFSFNYALENSDTIDFLSPYIFKGIKEREIKINEEKVAIAPCSFTDYSKCKSGDKKNFEIAFASRLEPDKNPMLYLEAMKEVLKKHSEAKFHLLGEGTLVKEINEFINSNGLRDSINFQFHKNPPEIFAKTSVFVSLQSNTNYPSQSVLEAMACGNAIIASNVGDTRLFINDSNGILIELDKNELVSALDKLISTPQLASRLGAAGRELVLQNHTIEKYSDYCLGLINKTYNKVFQ